MLSQARREQRQQRAVGLGQARRQVRSKEQALDTLDLLLKGAGLFISAGYI